MLKIKDNVDLKELEKFGFEEYKYSYWRDISNIYTVIIDKETRKIEKWNFAYGGKPTSADKYIQDLIQAGLVEKVVEE